MQGEFATRLFRITFVLAGAYNLAFGIWAGFWPLQFFKIFEIEPPRYPQIWACLGMVVGVYGLLYWHAAWRLDTARPIIAVGLLGKVLGPVGMCLSMSDSWPARLAMLNVYNDVIWWLPFSLFLLRGSRLAARLVALAPYLCAGLHLLALGLMAFTLRRGMLTEPDSLERATYIATHSTVWAIGWFVWMLAALSLVGFYAWWACQLPRPLSATICVLLAALGSVCDLSGESLCVLTLVERATSSINGSIELNLSDFESRERTITLLTAGAANLLYTLAGAGLLWQTKGVPSRVRFAMWATFIAGGLMTLAALFNDVMGMSFATAVLFPFLIAWTAWMGRYWRGT